MKIKSPAFLENQLISSTYSRTGDNINPPLEIVDIPGNAQSLVLIMDDPDAPGGIFTHWLMWNIPPNTTKIDENDWPEGAEQGMNGRGELGYTGPNPPSGVHHYYFKIYALNKKLEVSVNISREELEREIERGLIDKAELVGVYPSSAN